MNPRQLHIEINSASKVHISPTKHNVRSLRHMLKRERVKKAIEVYGKPIPSTFEAFEEYFSEVLMKNLMDGHNSGDPSKHLNPDQMICCGLHVDAEANIMFAVISTVNLLLNPIRALMSGMGRELYGDATHKVAQQLINISQLGVADVQGKGHLWGLCYHPHGHESADMYKNFHASLFIAMNNVVDNLMLCYSRSCRTCTRIHDMIEQ